MRYSQKTKIKKNLKILMILSTIVVTSNCITIDSNDDVLSRSRRQLIFPNSTVIQVNAGVGTPSPVKNINVNWGFQANFQLPWNRSQIPIDILEANSAYVSTARKKRDTALDGYENDAKLYHFYKYVEDVLNGYNGTACVLRTMCQLGQEPLQSVHEEDLLHELASFVLNPENDIVENEPKDATPYVRAYNEGKQGKNCLVYSCSISLIDMFSKLYADNLED